MDLNEFESILGIDELKNNLSSLAKSSRKNQGIGCVLCNYTGYTNSDNNKSVMCKCQKDKFYKEIFTKCNVPNLYLNKTIEDWNTRTDSLGNDLGMQQIVSQNIYTLLNFYDQHFTNICQGKLPRIKHTTFVRNTLHSILFEGGIGSGKTFIASVMVQSAIKKNLTAKYYDWSELLECFIDFDKKEKADEIIDDFKNLNFIALDGVEYLNYNHPQMAFQIDRLSKARLNSGKPIMIFASNNYSQITAGSGWNSLLRNCLTIRLPSTIK